MDTIFNKVVDFRGEIAALLCAGLWAIASVIYARLGELIPPIQLNLMKGIVAIALLLLTILIKGELLIAISPLPLCLLILSGIVGIGLGDTAFLAAINCLGARRALLIETLAPALTAILALVFLEERLNITAWSGILLSVFGVAWVAVERTFNRSGTVIHLWQGLNFSLLSAIATATGSVLARAAFLHGNVSPLWAALLRLSGGLLIIVVWISFPNRRRSFQLETLRSRRVIAAAFFAIFFGTYLGIWLQQTAIKFTTVGIASTLLQTSPLFVIPIAIWRGEKVSLRAVIGVTIAIAGIALLFYLK
ncbi:MAG: DMT family transporter [Rhizonema sp. NSF051]|nr:DMT family transporter [Rhizonema sp. NSF051]